MHPTRDQQGLAFHNGLNERQAGPLGIAGLGEVTINDVVGRRSRPPGRRARRNIGRCRHGCDWKRHGSHGSRQRAVAINKFAGRDGRQRPCGRNSERMHRFANEIFAQDRSQGGAAISAPRERRSARALQLNVAPLAVSSRTSPGGLHGRRQAEERNSRTDARHRPSRSARRPPA